MPEENSKHIRLLKILLHIGFFASGIATVLIGQVLPFLASKFSLSDGAAGNFFPAQFAGSLIGTFLTSWFGKRHKFLLASFIGCMLMGAGVAMLNLNSVELCLLGFFVNGLGIGLTLPSINMLVLELNPNRAGAALSFLNFFWGAGAIISQPFVDYLQRGSSILLPTAILSASLLLLGLVLAMLPNTLEQKPETDESNAVEPLPPIWTNPVAWAIAGFNFIHIGFESGMGGWLKTYSERIEDYSATNPFPPIMLFFLLFVVGRGVAPVFFRYFSENKMLIASLFTILAGMIVLLVAKDTITLSIGASITGFGTSAIFPTNMSRFTKTFGATASRRAMPFFICGTLGAAFTTWLIGFMSNRFNDLRSGMFILLGSVVVLIVIQIGLGLQERFRQQSID